MEGGSVGHNFERDPPKDHPCQVWFNLVQGFQRRRFKCESLRHTDGRWPTDAKSSHGRRWAKNGGKIWWDITIIFGLTFISYLCHFQSNMIFDWKCLGSHWRRYNISFNDFLNYLLYLTHLFYLIINRGRRKFLTKLTNLALTIVSINGVL
jgi:hypothetical protein